MLTIKINDLSEFNANQKSKILHAVDLLQQAVNSDLFRNGIVGHGYTIAIVSGCLWWKYITYKEVYGFHYTNDLPEDIYGKIMTGKKVLYTDEDYEIDIDLHLAATRGSVISFTYPDIVKTWVAKWFIDSASPAEIAGNMFHEWCHKIGYDHEYKNMYHRQFSVPYAAGYLVEEIATKIAAGQVVS